MTLVESIISELSVFNRGNGWRGFGGGGATPLFWIIGGKLPNVALYINLYKGHTPNPGPRGGVKWFELGLTSTP